MLFPQFLSTVAELQRDGRLRKTARSVQQWRAGRIPAWVRLLADNPELLDAIRDDVAIIRAKNSSKNA